MHKLLESLELEIYPLLTTYSPPVGLQGGSEKFEAAWKTAAVVSLLKSQQYGWTKEQLGDHSESMYREMM